MAASLNALLLATEPGRPKAVKSLHHCFAKDMPSNSIRRFDDKEDDKSRFLRWVECEFAHHRALPDAGVPISTLDRVTEQSEFSSVIAPADI
jgi:hypothetical protein